MQFQVMVLFVKIKNVVVLIWAFMMAGLVVQRISLILFFFLNFKIIYKKKVQKKKFNQACKADFECNTNFCSLNNTKSICQCGIGMSWDGHICRRLLDFLNLIFLNLKY